MTLLTIIATFLALGAAVLLLVLNALGQAYRTLRREEVEMLAAESWPVRAAPRSSACRKGKNPARQTITRRRSGGRIPSSPSPRVAPSG